MFGVPTRKSAKMSSVFICLSAPAAGTGQADRWKVRARAGLEYDETFYQGPIAL